MREVGFSTTANNGTVMIGKVEKGTMIGREKGKEDASMEGVITCKRWISENEMLSTKPSSESADAWVSKKIGGNST